MSKHRLEKRVVWASSMGMHDCVLIGNPRELLGQVVGRPSLRAGGLSVGPRARSLVWWSCFVRGMSAGATTDRWA